MSIDFGWDDAAVWCADPTAGEDDLAEDELAWCSTCKEFALMTPLTEAIAEEAIDPDFPMLLCEGCGYTTPLGYEPELEPYVQHAQCGDCKVGTLVTQPDSVPDTVGVIWRCDTCGLVRLVPRMTPLVAARELLWGMGEGPPVQWHYVVAQDTPYMRVQRTGG